MRQRGGGGDVGLQEADDFGVVGFGGVGEGNETFELGAAELGVEILL